MTKEQAERIKGLAQNFGYVDVLVLQNSDAWKVTATDKHGNRVVFFTPQEWEQTKEVQ